MIKEILAKAVSFRVAYMKESSHQLKMLELVLVLSRTSVKRNLHAFKENSFIQDILKTASAKGNQAKMAEEITSNFNSQ